MSLPFPVNADEWLLENAPYSAVAVSSRARLARNLPRVPFAPRASHEQLRYIAERVRAAFARNPALAAFLPFDLATGSAPERGFLRESHLISTELEKGGLGRVVFLSPAMDASIMINEEDHLRLATLSSGLRIEEVYSRLLQIEQAVEAELELAFSEEFGYLTACPTNTGTGLRLSVMLHLPALVMIGQIEETLATLGSFGLVVRGAYGEHSEHIGDLFQISNEVTLGKSEQKISQILEKIVNQIVERELQARGALQQEARDRLEDAVFRALGVLATARRMDSVEAVSLLSRVRLGIDNNWGVSLSHPQLNRLFVDVQPSHLQCLRQAGATPDARDAARAEFLRDTFRLNGGHSQN